ncbi:hypothetical protein [Pacificibacter marinus]|uniref:50S ribosomal protein L35 n=1 Tax=Pacificibacter marinus TaxID=658057 RepID=A0A1Y5THB7_9RHOB|nr:hypothetical protein [Pacificibacter marinus]SEL19111.1 hypothetical protein SAMN04488032_113102 [Pacificibacter marinus]SLN63892.1 hypothetical protein PAM7971_03338 [Pacificibacter marinus]
MDTDLFLVIGVALLVLALPTMIGAFSESRPPRVAAVLVVIGGGMIVWAVTQKTGGYAWDDIPQALVRVIGRYF